MLTVARQKKNAAGIKILLPGNNNFRGAKQNDFAISGIQNLFLSS
jgi:hypothetical protein